MPMCMYCSLTVLALILLYGDSASPCEILSIFNATIVVFIPNFTATHVITSTNHNLTIYSTTVVYSCHKNNYPCKHPGKWSCGKGRGTITIATPKCTHKQELILIIHGLCIFVISFFEHTAFTIYQQHGRNLYIWWTHWLLLNMPRADPSSLVRLAPPYAVSCGGLEVACLLTKGHLSA